MPAVGFVIQHSVMTASLEAESDSVWTITQQFTITAFIHTLKRHLSCKARHTLRGFSLLSQNAALSVFMCESGAMT